MAARPSLVARFAPAGRRAKAAPGTHGRRLIKAGVAPLALAALVGLGDAGEAAPKWTRVRTRDFVLVGDASEKQIRRTAAYLEQFREVVVRALPNLEVSTGVPTTVVVFSSHRAFRPYKPLYDGRPMDVAGYFQPGQDVDHITVTLEGGDDAFRIVFHEYVHLIVRHTFVDLPVWFNEGLAEYYSTFNMLDGGRRAALGRPIAAHVGLLRERFLPLADVLAVDRSSPLYNEGSKRTVFYAESWAVLHYLMRRKPDRSAELGVFLARLGQGRAPDEAFREAFRMEPAALEQEVRRYVLVTYRDDLKGGVACGPRQPHDAVYVTFRPFAGSDAPAGLEGVVVAIEFLPKGFIP